MATPHGERAIGGAAVVSFLELIGRMLLIGSGILYALGFIVANIHLARFGYFSLSLFERRYALAGFWALAPFLIFLMSQNFLEQGERLAADRSIKIPAKLHFFISLFFHYLSFYAFQTAFRLLLGVNYSLIWLPFMLGSGLLYMMSARGAVHVFQGLSAHHAPPLLESGSSQEEHPPAPHTMTPGGIARTVLARVNWQFAPLWVMYLVTFTNILYPRIPASWGGGGPERVQLLIPAEAAASLATLGLHRLNREISAPALLVATTADDYVIFIDSTRTAFVRRDLVRAMTLEGRFKAPSPMRRTYTDTTRPRWWER